MSIESPINPNKIFIHDTGYNGEDFSLKIECEVGDIVTEGGINYQCRINRLSLKLCDNRCAFANKREICRRYECSNEYRKDKRNVLFRK